VSIAICVSAFKSHLYICNTMFLFTGRRQIKAMHMHHTTWQLDIWKEWKQT